MSEARPRLCTEVPLSEQDQQEIGDQVWEALVDADCFVEGDFTFASGQRATLKVDADRLYTHREQLNTVLGLYAIYPCVYDADVLTYVPDGPRELTSMLGERLGLPVAHTERVKGGGRADFIFSSGYDEQMATDASRLMIVEDIVTTLGSTASLRRLVHNDREAHSLAMLLRGTVNPDHRQGLVDHYLLEREIPTDKDEFKRHLEEVW